MVATQTKTRKPLLTVKVLQVAAEHHSGVDTRGLRHLPVAEASAIVKSQAYGIRPMVVGDKHWVVASASRPGTAHELRVWGERVTCDCEGYRARKFCWHAELVAHELHVAALGLPSALEPVTRLQDLYSEYEYGQAGR